MLLLILTLFQLQADPYTGQDFSGVWPGFNSKVPIVLNYPDGSKTFNFEGELPKGIEQVALDPDYKIGDKSAFVMRYQDSFTFIHELFHRFQKDRFSLVESVEYPDLYNPENQALMQVEEEILLQYMKNAAVMNDYLLVRQFRMSKLESASIQFEDREERLEGLANFVAMKVTGDERPVVSMLEGMAKDKNVVDKALKWRFYVTGALLGKLLDEEGIDWKDKVKDKPLFSFVDVKEDGNRLKALLEEHKYEEKVKQMASQIEMIKTGIQRLREDYARSQGHEVHISFLSAPSSGGNVQKILALGQNEKVALKESGRTESREWILETNQIPFIFKTKEGLALKVTNPIVVNGREIDPAAITEPVSFKEIAWSDSQSRFRSKKEGVLIPHENRLEISFQASD